MSGEQQAVVVLNCGSSTAKFGVFTNRQETTTLSGSAEALGTSEATLRWSIDGLAKSQPIPNADHRIAIGRLTGLISECGAAVVGIGHRVVHGGEIFKGPAKVDERVLRQIDELAPLAPLHNPANGLGLRLMEENFPGVQQVAVFDTAFHQTLPPHVHLYALPAEFHKRYGIRRYGFHGTSHQFVAAEAARRLNRSLAGLQLITVHLGNGCSACAIKNGGSVDTTMGLTPSEGMMMGTRSGDVDPLLPQFLATNAGMKLEEISGLLIRKSGLLGVSGFSNDRRQLEQRAQEGDARATLALEMFCFRAAKAVLGLTASLDRIDAVIFTGGIGEHSAFIRRRIADQTQLLGLTLDALANEGNGASHDGIISAPGTRPCLVIPTNEELAIAREVWKLI